MAVKRRRRYPKKHRDFLNLHRYKYELILKAQKGGCAICGRKPSDRRRLDMDHSHQDPMVLRGLLCFKCNRALKDFMDEAWLKAALKHIKKNWND